MTRISTASIVGAVTGAIAMTAGFALSAQAEIFLSAPKVGKTVYVGRPGDAGDRLYRPVKYDIKEQDLMPRYDVNKSPTGSIADVKAKAAWRDGYWQLEFARKLNTGHDDDVVIPAKGAIKIAVAAFNDVEGRNHSTSDDIVPKTGT